MSKSNDTEMVERFKKAYPAVVKGNPRWHWSIQYKDFKMFYEYFGQNVPKGYRRKKKKPIPKAPEHFYRTTPTGKQFESKKMVWTTFC